MDEMENSLTGNKASITKSAIEDKFLEELVNCNELQHQITEASTPQPKIESRKNIGVIKSENEILKTRGFLITAFLKFIIFNSIFDDTMQIVIKKSENEGDTVFSNLLPIDFLRANDFY